MSCTFFSSMMVYIPSIWRHCMLQVNLRLWDPQVTLWPSFLFHTTMWDTVASEHVILQMKSHVCNHTVLLSVSVILQLYLADIHMIISIFPCVQYFSFSELIEHDGLDFLLLFSFSSSKFTNSILIRQLQLPFNTSFINQPTLWHYMHILDT